MKIGILTHELGLNYGGILQNYALQQILNSLGHDSITLNHKAPNVYTLPIKIGSFIKQCLRKINGSNEKLRVWTTKEEQKYISKNISTFVKNRIKYTDPFSLEDLKTNIPDDLNAIIVGSDQVWNPNYIKPIERFFLSDFEHKKILKISYAASFGGKQWNFNRHQTQNCKRLAQKFDLITVRENSGVERCKKYLGVEAHHVLDPTMLLSSDHYRSLLNIENVFKTSKMMVYILDKSESKLSIVNTVANQLNLEINSLMPQCRFREVGTKGIDKCVYPSVESWISGFNNADFVITDSFHGTVFSIIFNKPFITIINRERGADRFTSLLKLFGLEDRLVDVNDNYLRLLNSPINYDHINDMIKIKQNESIALLNKYLNYVD